MKKLAMWLMASGLGVGSLGFFPGSTLALPGSQGVCAFDFQTTTSTSGTQPIPGLTLRVTNTATSSRKALVQVSADMGVDPDAEVRISYVLDNGAPLEDFFGPANLANNAQFFEGRMVMAVIPIPPGTHTIRPFWRVSGSPGKGATIDSRCATVELTTK